MTIRDDFFYITELWGKLRDKWESFLTPVFVTGGTVRMRSPVSDFTGALVTISYPHHEIHEGSSYRVWFVQPHGALLANDASIDLVLTTTTRFPHIIFSLGYSGDCEFYIYRAPNFNADGTLQVPHNLRDILPVTPSTVTARWNPTINAVGTEIDGEFIAGGTGGNAVGGAIRGGTEDIFRLATSYLIRLTNRSGQANQFSVEGQWYEESTA